VESGYLVQQQRVAVLDQANGLFTSELLFLSKGSCSEMQNVHSFSLVDIFNLPG